MVELLPGDSSDLPSHLSIIQISGDALFPSPHLNWVGFRGDAAAPELLLLL